VTLHAAVQSLIAVFGVVPLTMAMGHNQRARKWAPIVGLCGQPVWATLAWQTDSWGLGIATVAFTIGYANGVRMQWGGRPT
jgi:hypothetical protein